MFNPQLNDLLHFIAKEENVGNGWKSLFSDIIR